MVGAGFHLVDIMEWCLVGRPWGDSVPWQVHQDDETIRDCLLIQDFMFLHVGLLMFLVYHDTLGDHTKK